MAQLKNVVEPFGEVNVYPAGPGKLRVVATILMEPRREGTQTGIALDGSGSMAELYGVGAAGAVSIFTKARQTQNEITPVAQQLCAYLARKIDADGGTTCVYWATGPGGSRIEEIGDLTAEQAERHVFGPPRSFGTGTQLLPAVRYFVDRFADAPWGFYVFITDGELHDLDEVKAYSRQLAREVSTGRRRPVKFVLIGVGRDVNEKQMEELDDLDTGTEVDLWDHKLASELRSLVQIFAEVVDTHARIADKGRILDNRGRVVKDYSDTGVPAKLEFEIDAGSGYFTLEAEGNRIHQGLFDRASVPPSELAARPTAPAKPTQPTQPAAAAQDLGDMSEIPEVLPVEEAESEPKEEVWTGFDLKMEKDNLPEIELRPDEPKKP
jgi:hypothetical protein